MVGLCCLGFFCGLFGGLWFWFFVGVFFLPISLFALFGFRGDLFVLFLNILMTFCSELLAEVPLNEMKGSNRWL